MWANYLMKLVNRVKAILLSPQAEWKVIEQERDTLFDLLISYVAILAAIPEIAHFIGQSLIGGYAPIVPSLVRAVVVYFVAFAMVYIIAGVIDLLAPRFRRREELSQCRQAIGLFPHAALARGHFSAHPGSELPVDPGSLRVLPAVGRVAHADEGAKRQGAALRGDRHRLCAHPRDRADDDLATNVAVTAPRGRRRTGDLSVAGSLALGAAHDRHQLFDFSALIGLVAGDNRMLHAMGDVVA